MRFRILNKLYANVFGFFWLPCPLCEQPFGGHEWMVAMKSSTEKGEGICPDCTKAGKGHDHMDAFSNAMAELRKEMGDADCRISD